MTEEELTKVLEAFLTRKYVQRPGRFDGLVYMEVETHDLARELGVFLLSDGFEKATGGFLVMHRDDMDGG